MLQLEPKIGAHIISEIDLRLLLFEIFSLLSRNVRVQFNF